MTLPVEMISTVAMALPYRAMLQLRLVSRQLNRITKEDHCIAERIAN